jgi:hypothetical protein
MTDPKMLDLVRRLADKANGLEWKRDQTAGGFYTKLGDNYAEFRSDDRDDSHPYTFAVFDQNERLVESLNTLKSDIPPELRELIEQAYRVAKRKATGVDDVIEDMLEQLE